MRKSTFVWGCGVHENTYAGELADGLLEPGPLVVPADEQDAVEAALGAEPGPFVCHRPGDLQGPGTNATHGEGDIFVAEADESDRSFQKYDPEVAIVLNVELDHHANYASMDEIYDSFETFVGKVVPGGTLVISADQPGAVELTRRVRALADLKVVTYGSAEDADVRVHKVTPRGLTGEVAVLLNGVCRIVSGSSCSVPVNIDDLERQVDRNGGVPPRVVDSLLEHGHVDLVVRAAAERDDWFCA